jgi:molecular chaperone GrpE
MTNQETIDATVNQEPEQELDPGQELESGPAMERSDEGTGEEQEEIEQAPVQEELSEEEILRAELEEAQAKAEEYLDGWQRARAEFANYRRREEQRRQQLGEAIKGQTLSGLLPVLDDLDRAFQAVPQDVRESAWVKGLSMVGSKLQSTLEKEGVTAMDIQPGEGFDPNYHQAVFHGPSAEYAEGRIVEVFQRGYTLGETVLRPAMVYVSSGAPEEPRADGELEAGGEPEADSDSAGNES